MAREHEAPRLDGRRLLVVEDDYIIAIELARSLEELGAEVLGPVGTVRAALGLVAKNRERLDGAVLDVNLGSELAYPIADALAERAIPFVFATGYDEFVIPAAYAGAPRCEKPVDNAALARVLARQWRAGQAPRST
ncbi:MAG: response regulator [Reyranellaceae bacterium]